MLSSLLVVACTTLGRFEEGWSIDASAAAMLQKSEGIVTTKLNSSLTIAAAYLCCVLVASFVMMVFKPYKVQGAKFCYNVFQMILKAYMTLEAVFLAKEVGYSFMACNTNVPFGHRAVSLYWLFYISKIFDFCDTAFIVLGKKWKQLSFLHLYHHAGSLVMTNLMLKVPRNNELIPTIAVNCFVHFVTYTYLFVAMHCDKKGKPIWWKKYVLPFELLQFVILLAQVFVFPTSCKNAGDELDNITVAGRVVAIAWYVSQFVLFCHLYTKQTKKQKMC